MPGNPTIRDLLEVQKYFDLPSPALVEKDWYVVKAIAALNAARMDPFLLVFGGGTALSRVSVRSGEPRPSRFQKREPLHDLSLALCAVGNRGRLLAPGNSDRDGCLATAVAICRKERDFVLGRGL